MKILITLLITFTLTACVSSGRKIDSSYVDRIEKGITTEQQVIANLGQPTATAISANGQKIMTYMHVTSQARPESFIPVAGFFVGGADAQSTMFMIIVDSKTGIVEDWNYSQSNSSANTGTIKSMNQETTVELEDKADNNVYEKSVLPTVLFFFGWLFLMVGFIAAFQSLAPGKASNNDAASLMQSAYYATIGIIQLLFFLALGKIIELLERIYMDKNR